MHAVLSAAGDVARPLLSLVALCAAIGIVTYRDELRLRAREIRRAFGPVALGGHDHVLARMHTTPQGEHDRPDPRMLQENARTELT